LRRQGLKPWSRNCGTHMHSYEPPQQAAGPRRTELSAVPLAGHVAPRSALLVPAPVSPPALRHLNDLWALAARAVSEDEPSDSPDCTVQLEEALGSCGTEICSQADSPCSSSSQPLPSNPRAAMAQLQELLGLVGQRGTGCARSGAPHGQSDAAHGLSTSLTFWFSRLATCTGVVVNGNRPLGAGRSVLAGRATLHGAVCRNRYCIGG
jgi:hypothetical protein